MAQGTCSQHRGGHRFDASPTTGFRVGARESLAEALRTASESRGGALVVRGAAGIGKTALLQDALVSADGFQVATVVGAESERDLSYAALHRLCVTMLDGIDRLPDPQQHALGAALGVRSGDIDPFFVGLAVLGLLAESSAREPVLCIVDDAQWIDPPSMRALAFVARRIGTDRVALVFGAREPVDELAGVPELLLRGLSDAEARDLLASVVPGPLDTQVRDRIVDESNGNPRALLALLRASSPEQLAGGFGLPVSLASTDPFVATSRAQLAALPEPTRHVLLIAAAEPEGDPGLFWRAVARLGIEPGAADEAVAFELLQLGTRVTFKQPEMRSVVYHDASPTERRRIHGALADTIGPEDDPDRRAWHRGQATLGTDECVADALERSAVNAQVRGGFAAAAAFLERSAVLTPEADRRARRAFLAARAKYEAGSIEAASDLLTMADRGSLDDVDRAQLDRLRAELALALRRGNDAPPLLLDAAQALERLDVQLARDTYLQRLEAAFLGGGHGLLEAARSGRAAPLATVPGAADLLLDGLALWITDGYPAAVPTVQRAVRAFRSEADGRWLGLACRASAEVWDDDASFVLATRWVQLSRDTGALTQLPVALDHIATLHVHAGEFDAAAGLIDEASTVAEATGLDRTSNGALVLAAWRGGDGRTAELIEGNRREALARGDGRLLSDTEYSAAVLYNGLGRYQDALDALRPTYEREELFSSWFLPELVEAAARTGDRAFARAAAVDLAERAQTGGTEWALGIRARSLALVTEGPAAEKLHREAIERLGRGRASAHLARAHLLYGEWLRRVRRRLEAREQLHLAHDLFSSMGAAAFAARALRELAATGERARRRDVTSSRELTPQELSIARLASTGDSNPQIGAQLFISARTVEYHLHKVFTKLDIRSRTQLADALGVDSDAPVIGHPGGAPR